ncbi:putative membrane protein (DUF2127) [Synechococcus sp. PCC 7502]|uniref:DUF2127 domain-containing protein n=1 Tax=Synechococcus sp. PCC 7502 TaxID=1173263 RepID=UPI00029F8CBA|nr:DUF2127 domain-containing protein [Synechococcus sp. PCC 7502]AFY75211.1 putative membrane protein (DUF2127) [Synechococcus sp. PCC 7502]
MSKLGKRPKALIAIVSYKSFTATLFATASLGIFLAAKNYEGLENLADSLALSGKRGIIAWVLEKILNFEPRNLKFSAIALAVYSGVTAIEAVGLWYEKAWARWLVVGVVGISIPPEIFELWHGVSILKLVVFILNLGILWYLIREFPKEQPQEQSQGKSEKPNELAED